MYSESKNEKPLIALDVYLSVNGEMFKGKASLFGIPKMNDIFVTAGTTFKCKSNTEQNAPVIAIADNLYSESSVSLTRDRLIAAGFTIVDMTEKDRLIICYAPELALAAELQH